MMTNLFCKRKKTYRLCKVCLFYVETSAPWNLRCDVHCFLFTLSQRLMVLKVLIHVIRASEFVPANRITIYTLSIHSHKCYFWARCATIGRFYFLNGFVDLNLSLTNNLFKIL